MLRRDYIMNLINLKSNHEILLSHMKKEGYSHRYIEKFNTELNRIFKYAKDNESYLEYYNRVLKPYARNDKRDGRLDILNILMNFDLYNKLPDRTRVKHKIMDNSNYHKLCDEFKSIIDTYVKVSSKTEKKASTIHREALNGASFLIYLQKRKITAIRDITEADVLSFFLNDNNSNISLRNKAIVTILLYTGLRGCDIYSLKLNNIDLGK